MTPSPWPFGRPQQLADALREQGIPPDEIADLLPTVQRLAEVPTPQPTPADTQRLIAQLMPVLPGFSPVRQAIRAHRQQHSNAAWLLATARTQVTLFGMAFWLVSALITLVGAVASIAVPGQDVVLRASGPLLVFMGTIVAFRGMPGRVLECELVCLPSLVQLTIARLVIVLGYDLGLGLALGLTLWASGTGQVVVLVLSWFMPLLLVAGLALLLSLHLAIPTAATLAYGGWLAFLAIEITATMPVVPLTPLTDTLLGGMGLVGLTIALLHLRTSPHRLLPRF